MTINLLLQIILMVTGNKCKLVHQTKVNAWISALKTDKDLGQNFHFGIAGTSPA